YGTDLRRMTRPKKSTTSKTRPPIPSARNLIVRDIAIPCRAARWRLRYVLPLDLHLDLTGPDCCFEGRMIALGLVRVRHRKTADPVVESVLPSQIACDPPGIAGLGMRTSEHPAACFGIHRQHFRVVGLDHRTQLHVAQLPDVEVPTLRARRPTEEDVRC